jgi:hypothetical protein
MAQNSFHLEVLPSGLKSPKSQKFEDLKDLRGWFQARHRSLEPANRQGGRFSENPGPEARSRMRRAAGQVLDGPNVFPAPQTYTRGFPKTNQVLGLAHSPEILNRFLFKILLILFDKINNSYYY